MSLGQGADLTNQMYKNSSVFVFCNQLNLALKLSFLQMAEINVLSNSLFRGWEKGRGSWIQSWNSLWEPVLCLLRILLLSFSQDGAWVMGRLMGSHGAGAGCLPLQAPAVHGWGMAPLGLKASASTLSMCVCSWCHLQSVSPHGQSVVTAPREQGHLSQGRF